VGDEHDGRPLGVHLAEDVEHLGGRRRVERPGRLVTEDDRRLVDERPADADPLELPARGLRDVPVRQVGDAGPLHQPHRPLVELGAGRQARQVGRQHDVVQQAQVLQQVHVLEDEAHGRQPQPGQLLGGERAEVVAGEGHAPGGDGVQPAHRVEQRGLPRAGGAHDGDELARADLQVHAVEHGPAVEGLGESPRVEDRGRGGGHGSRPTRW
jgi:hypothetical protein